MNQFRYPNMRSVALSLNTKSLKEQSELYIIHKKYDKIRKCKEDRDRRKTKSNL
jgi:hypothetical protein